MMSPKRPMPNEGRFPRMVSRKTAINAVVVALTHGIETDAYKDVYDGPLVVGGNNRPTILIDDDTYSLISDAYGEALRLGLSLPNVETVNLREQEGQ